jgi:hypothetical protein
MRWDDVFGDLEAQFAAALDEQAVAELAERLRFERGQVTLAERLQAARGSDVVVGAIGVPDVRGRLSGIGPDWLLLQEERGIEAVVLARAVTWVERLGRPADPSAGGTASPSRVDLRMLLGRIARDRSPVVVHLRDGETVTGTLAGRGADHVDVAVHPAGEDIRSARALRTVPLVALSAVRRS